VAAAGAKQTSDRACSRPPSRGVRGHRHQSTPHRGRRSSDVRRSVRTQPDQCGSARGRSVLTNPMLNRGKAFTYEERCQLGLECLLPSGVSPLDGQLRRVYAQYNDSLTTWPRTFSWPTCVTATGPVLPAAHRAPRRDAAPIVYTQTVGEAIQRCSHEYRGPAACSSTSTTRRTWRNHSSTTASARRMWTY
jgi:hypothetical protein